MGDVVMDREHWMTDDQFACAEMFAGVVGGFHHVSGKFTACGTGVKVHVFPCRFGTADSDYLSRLVIRAHDEMIRVSLISSGPRRVGFTLHRRFERDGSIAKRHETIESAIERHRKKLPTIEGQSDDR